MVGEFDQQSRVFNAHGMNLRPISFFLFTLLGVVII
jgi:hypothetical protein